MPRKPQFLSSSIFDNIGADIQAALLEFVGTTCFLTLAYGGVQAVASESVIGANSTAVRLLYISFCFGFSLLVSAWLFFRVTGGLFNPDVSLALLLTGIIGPVRFVLYCIAQLTGGIAAAGLILALTPGPLQSNTFLQNGVNKAQGVFIEAFITAVLCMAVLMLAAEKHGATPFAPVGIGLTVFACHLFAVYYTGAGMNTARSFGPAAVTGFPYKSQWIYWVGPGIGSTFAAVFYGVLKHLRYWKLNPGQDTIDARESPREPLINTVVRTRSLSTVSSRGANRSGNAGPKVGRVDGVAEKGESSTKRGSNDSPV